jgi:hypothetical protein
MAGPSFGAVSVRLGTALRSHPGVRVSGEYWYAESCYERRAGKALSRVLRTVCDPFPLPSGVRERVEAVCASVRFRRGRAAADIGNMIAALGPLDTLILVKPMFLRSEDIEGIRVATGARTLVLYLWDALWRTPDIRPLLPLFDAVYTTEPADCSDTIRLLSLPRGEAQPSRFGDTAGTGATARPERSSTDGHGPANSATDGHGVFFCGAASLGRLISAVAVRKECRRRSLPCHVALVTDNRLAARVVGRFGFTAHALAPEQYRDALSSCDVVLDLGRTAQTSPSERFGDAVAAGKMFLTANPTFAVSYPPVIFASQLRGRALTGAFDRLTADGSALSRPMAWAGHVDVARFDVSAHSWTSTVLGDDSSEGRV